MRTVWKMPVAPTHGVQVLSPTTAREGARPVALNVELDALVMHFELDPDAPPAEMDFAVVGTGWAVPDGFEHVDTCPTDGGYVWHLYRRAGP